MKILHEMGHVLGIGTQWLPTGISSSLTGNCNYLGERATTEFQAISGCAFTIPLKPGGERSSCL